MSDTPDLDESCEITAVELPTKVPTERSNFRFHLLANPNYFGNLESSLFNPITELIGDTTYEEISCVGLAPPFDRLEAVIEVKQGAGYSGGICDPGSDEYVRFYVDLHNDGTWHDVGVASVAVHDIPGAKPLCYAVLKDFSSVRELCTTENIVKVRAILSWAVAPTADAPEFQPVWGNVVDVHVQIQPAGSIDLGILLANLVDAEVQLPDPIGPIVSQLDLTTKLFATRSPGLNLAEKRSLYARADVPVHRFAFTEAQAILAAPATAQTVSPFIELGLSSEEVSGLLGQLEQAADGDTSFEQLRCVGLHPANDMLEAVLTVKKQAGYSGELCGSGSTEFVAFWIDFGDGSGFKYQGTATVNVHDLATTPVDGIQYAAFLKTDLSKHRVPCEKGPRLVRVRAILSWENAPPPANPNFVPVWGNREECQIQLEPGEVAGHVPVIETVGNMRVNRIVQSTGLATGFAELALYEAQQSPFGGTLAITGRIGDPPDSFGGPAPQFKYRIEVSPADPAKTDWQPLSNPITVAKSEFQNGMPIYCSPFEIVCDEPLTATDDGDGLGGGWYPYIEDTKGPDTRNLVVNKLAEWHTSVAQEGMWKIRITAKDPSTSPPTVYPGLASNEIRVRVDNTRPTAPPPGPSDPAANIKLAIVAATFKGKPITAVDCGKFPVGSIITGTYSVHDPATTDTDPGDTQHFGALGLDVIPSGPAHGATVVPPNRTFPAVPTTGEDGTWSLNTGDMTAPNPPTTPMQPCGYVIRLTASDRTIVSGGSVGLSSGMDVGFCLEEAPVA